MGVGIEWWELRLRRTNRDCIDAYVRIELGRMRVAVLSPKAERLWSDAIAALKWCQALRCAPSPAFPWKRVRAKRVRRCLRRSTPAVAKARLQRHCVRPLGLSSLTNKWHAERGFIGEISAVSEKRKCTRAAVKRCESQGDGAAHAPC
jgi:hypothetical protein